MRLATEMEIEMRVMTMCENESEGEIDDGSH